MLKPQDCVLLIKLIAHLNASWSQRQLAQQLGLSQSEVHAGFKRLLEAGLVRKSLEGGLPRPILAAAAEYLIHAVKYSFPVKLGEYTRGVPAGIAAPVFAGKIVLGDDPLPVWPYGNGEAKGVALEPLYRSIPEAIKQYSDDAFYDLLALVDIIRRGRARERKIAIQMLQEKLKYEE
jgi:DNA-binding Lrp family transcriptional regulator